MTSENRRINHPENQEINLPGKSDLVIVLVVILGMLLSADALVASWAGKASSLLVEAALLIFVVIYVILRQFPLKPLLRWYSVSRTTYPSVFSISAGLAILLDECDRLVAIIIPMPPEQVESLQNALSSTGSVQYALVFAGIVLITPFAEETIFRGFVQRTFEISHDITRAVLLTALVFAAVHLQPWWLIQLVILSMFLGYMAWKSGSIIPGAIAHALNNFWALFIINNPPERFNELYNWHGHVNPLWIIVALLATYYGYVRFNRCFTEP